MTNMHKRKVTIRINECELSEQDLVIESKAGHGFIRVYLRLAHAQIRLRSGYAAQPNLHMR